MRKTLNDPEFHRDFKKLSGFDASPLMPEEQEKVIRELPRDRNVVELFKKLSGRGFPAAALVEERPHDARESSGQSPMVRAL